MRFTISAIALFSSLVAANSTKNAFSIPTNGYTFTSGESTTLNWSDETTGTVSLRLQWTAITTPTTGSVIASGIQNTGTYTWAVPDDLIAGRAYTIEIIDDSDSSIYNFLPYFEILDATAAASVTTATSTASATTASSSSTDSATTATTTSDSTASTSAATTSGSTSAATTLSTATSTDSSTTSGDSTTAATSAATSTSTGVPSTGAGVANRVSAGMLALVAAVAAFL